jgi:hypothetical protein
MSPVRSARGMVDGAAQLAEQGQPARAVLVQAGVEQQEPGVGVRVDVSEGCLQPLADLDQQLVAVVVAEGVVDLLEPFQTQQE